MLLPTCSGNISMPSRVPTRMYTKGDFLSLWLIPQGRLPQEYSRQAVSNRRFSQLNDERCCHVRERSPSRCDRSFCRVPHKRKCFANRWVATFGWRALTDVPTSLVIQLRNPLVSKPPVRPSSLMTAVLIKMHTTGIGLGCFHLPS